MRQQHGQGKGEDSPAPLRGVVGAGVGTPSNISDQSDSRVGILNTKESAHCYGLQVLLPRPQPSELRAGVPSPPDHSHDTGLALKTDSWFSPNLLIPALGEEPEGSVFNMRCEVLMVVN